MNNTSPINLMPPDAIVADVLKKRAELLAKIPEKAKNSQEIPFIKIQLNKEFYGIPYQYVLCVQKIPVITQVAGVPNFIAGIINHQGGLLTVLNLKKILGFNETIAQEKQQDNNIIIVAVEQLKLGLVADEILGNDRYDPAMLNREINLNEEIAEYSLGVYAGNTTILTLEKILLDPKLQLAGMR